MKNQFFIIGCGGVGSWLAPSMCLLQSPDQIILIDGDTLEKKNLNRQLFTERDIGRNKAEALAERYGCQHRPEWYGVGLVDHDNGDWLLVCVDNNAARREALTECDRSGCHAIFAANEVFSAEAYYYRPEWRGTRLDPRVYYPSILTDRSNDPRSMSVGCTGEAQESNRQLVSANYMAAALAQNLAVLWSMEMPTLPTGVIPKSPYKLSSSISRLEYQLVGELIKNK